VKKTTIELTDLITDEVTGMQYGTISIRVVVLPRKTDNNPEETPTVADVSEDEVLPDESASPVGSYLERPKAGKYCCVFLVNGQRQDALDNAFIVQQLGFKYLRKRMMIIVDVDGLLPSALSNLMQGSRQGFYKGRVWEAMFSRLIATLKRDPDLRKFEEDAEAEVAKLEAGDQKVKEALDTLIEAHHQYADHVVTGDGEESGSMGDEPFFGEMKPADGTVVTLRPPTDGERADYPVLRANVLSLLLKPGEERVLTITSEPQNAWPALAGLAHTLDNDVPELHIKEDQTTTGVTFRLRFVPPDDFDPQEYPVRATMRVYARFNGLKDPRELSVRLTMRPAYEPPEPDLLDDPTYLRVTTRQPVRLSPENADTHVRLSWNGKDSLAVGPAPRWTFIARVVTPGCEIATTFSQPRHGRFSLLVPLPAGATLGDEFAIEVKAESRDGKTLMTAFTAIVAKPDEHPKPEPRSVIDSIPTGASRRPPYDLWYVYRDKWQDGTCWEGQNWTADDAAAYQEPTQKTPLTLIINNDMAALQELRSFFVEKKKLGESDVSLRLQKYTSHVAYHLYQMHHAAQSHAAQDEESGGGRPQTAADQRAEINRVAMTLLKVMQVSR
jgi:hypothetical protein